MFTWCISLKEEEEEEEQVEKKRNASNAIEIAGSVTPFGLVCGTCAFATCRSTWYLGFGTAQS